MPGGDEKNFSGNYSFEKATLPERESGISRFGLVNVVKGKDTHKGPKFRERGKVERSSKSALLATHLQRRIKKSQCTLQARPEEGDGGNRKCTLRT